MAESLTDKLKLSKRDTGDINWGQGANANLDAVDAHAQQATLRPPRTLSASLGSGAVGANLSGSATYFYKITAINAVGETTEGKIPVVLEAQVTESASPAPIILSWETVKGATGYKIYKSSVSGQEKFLASVSGEATAVYTDDGNTAVNGGISVPVANTARTSVAKIVAGTNITISPTDGTGDVTINAAGGTPPDASDTVKGDTKLSVAPALATNPIAVGDNDPRNTDARTPSGAAAGDLSGTYPNPAVAKVNGTSVPAAPSAGQVLTATGPTAATWQAPAGGYAATVVVAAPSGVAATDTANVLAALTAANAAGGGIVLLREGIYLINSTLTLGTNVSIVGQGKNATTLQAMTSVGATALIAMPNSESGLRHLCLDFNGATRGGNTVSDITVSGSNTFLDSVRTTRPNSTGTGLTAFLANTVAASAGAMVCINCEFNFNDKRAAFYFAVTNGSFLGCSFNISALSFSLMTDGAASSNVNVKGCSIVISTLNGIPSLFQTNFASQWVISDNAFWITAGASGTASGIDMNQPSNRASVTGNIANSTLCGAIGGSALTTISGNAGFNGYTGNGGTATASTRVGNDTLTFNGVAVSPTAPTTGQVLTATGAAAASWQTPAGGGGYGTLVVAAPSGTAATDTTNIQSAIDAVSAAGGGTVLLREGIYQISTTINPKSGVTIRGQGKSTVQNTGLSGTSGGGSPFGTTLRGTTGLGSTRMISDTGTAPINVTFRDLNLDFGKVTRGSITGQDMVMKGSNLTFINVTFIMTASVGNPSVDITPSNTFDAGKHKFIGCDFYDAGTAATICYQLEGLISGCYFEGTVATFNEMVAFVGAANVTNCYFASNKNYNNGMVYVQPANNSNQAQTVTISNCFFKQYTTAQTRAIFVNNITNGNVVISGNVGDSTSAVVGNIHCPASSGLRSIIGNVGFSAYSGGNQNGNDGQTAINSGAAAGGDLSGTLPSPTVAKVNGTSVPAAPSAGQVLTATGPTAATWQAPASGGYATVVVAAPTGVAATDTANIQAALNSIPVASGGGGGGVVILRQGIYVVNQITIFNEGTKLSGSGPGFTPNRDASPGSSLQAANPLSADMLVILASQVVVENISFKGFGLAAGFALVSGNMGNTIFRDCAFVDIKAGNIGIKATTGQDLKILDCFFQIHEQTVITVARTPIAIKVGAAGGGFSQNVDIIGNHFTMVVEVSPTGAGSIVGKAIEMTKVFKAVIERNQIEGNSGFVLVTGVTTIGVELFTDGSVESKGVVIGNNSGRSLNNFIRQATAFPKVTVCGNSYIKHVGSAPVIDLVSGNTNWAIAGNMIEGATGVNLAVGADSNVVAANIANVVNAGAGNSVVNNVAPI